MVMVPTAVLVTTRLVTVLENSQQETSIVDCSNIPRRHSADRGSSGDHEESAAVKCNGGLLSQTHEDGVIEASSTRLLTLTEHVTRQDIALNKSLLHPLRELSNSLTSLSRSVNLCGSNLGDTSVRARDE
jgi:hypothetical protein